MFDWFTELDSAVHEATRIGRPIVSLRLLGELGDELSCANSRFFKALLYTDPVVVELLRSRAVLHWASVRPVPKVTVDFGDGRRLETTLTGNSVHLVLDARGRPVDAVPGLFDAPAFARRIGWGLDCAEAVGERSGTLRRRALAKHHGRALGGVRSRPSRARRASEIAMTKHMVEAPMLGALERTISDDDTANAALHDRIHDWFGRGRVFEDAEVFTRAIYEELFEMPLDDPWLGLSPDRFDGLMNHGRSAVDER